MNTSAGCFGRPPEDRHHAKQLDVYLAQQDEAERREREIEERATGLMAHGKECDPFRLAHRSFGQVAGTVLHSNFFEAIQELPDAEFQKINALFRHAHETQLNHDFAKAGHALVEAVLAYWKSQAVAVAERGMK